MLAVYNHGYPFCFMFTSHSESFSDILDIYQGAEALLPTSKVVFQLATTFQLHSFTSLSTLTSTSVIFLDLQLYRNIVLVPVELFEPIHPTTLYNSSSTRRVSPYHGIQFLALYQSLVVYLLWYGQIRPYSPFLPLPIRLPQKQRTLFIVNGGVRISVMKIGHWLKSDWVQILSAVFLCLASWLTIMTSWALWISQTREEVIIVLNFVSFGIGSQSFSSF